MAQGLAAGVPQLVMAMSHDQPDNGNRLQRLGVGAYLYPRTFRPKRVAAELSRLMGSAQVREACRMYRHRIEGQMPAREVVRLLEEVHPAVGGARGTGHRA